MPPKERDEAESGEVTVTASGRETVNRALSEVTYSWNNDAQNIIHLRSVHFCLKSFKEHVGVPRHDSE
jgi:hypothetical protein